MERSESAGNAKEEKRAAIFEAACKVIRDKGFHQARITDIAQQAGISYGLVYHYFGSKGHLYEAILEEWWGSMFGVLDSCDKKTPTVKGKLRSIVDHFLNVYEERPNLLHIFITEISRSSTNLTPERRQFFKTFFDKTEQIMTAGQSAGELREDIRARYLTYIFLGAVESFLSTMVLEDQALKGPAQKERIATGLLEVFFNGAGIRNMKNA